MADSTRDREPLLVEDHDPDSDYSAVFEDDGKTAYVYLTNGGKIVGDVWLYNHAEPPAEPEWEDPSKMPFANSKEFVSNELFSPVADASEVNFDWTHQGDSLTLRLGIRGEPFAVLTPGSKPGWSKLAIKDGPLALRLKERKE